MKYKLISYENKKGTFNAENKNISYDNYILYFTRPANSEEIKNGSYRIVVVTIKAKAKEIYHIAKTTEELANIVGREFTIETEITTNGTKTYYNLA